jgi:Arrestin (or S-antigen), N-terminal domain
MQLGRYGTQMRVLEQRARHGPRTLTKGEHRFASRFNLPEGLPPTYRGGIAWVDYTLAVHASIPWWPDRRQSFAVPVGPAARDGGATPQSFVSSLEGPRGSTPFLELALESTTLEIGGVLAGAVSTSNTRNATIRALDLVLVAVEASSQSSFTYDAPRHRWRIFDGQPSDGHAVPFRIALPRNLQVGFAIPIFEVRWALDVIAEVVWGRDATLRAPVTLVPGRITQPEKEAARWVAPVGRERRAITWSTVADRHGMVNDAADERMSAHLGGATLVVSTQHRGVAGLHWVATVRWTPLGIDLHAEPRSWTDLFTPNRLDLGDGRAASKFTARAREAAQGRAVLDGRTIDAIARFDEATVNDDGAVMASRARAETLPQLDAFVRDAIVAAQALAAGIARVPPPEVMEANLAAWQAFAPRLGGQLQVGAMKITSTSFGPEAVEIETLWAGPGQIAGTTVRVLLSPPLEEELDLDSPATSAESRKLALAIKEGVLSVRLGPSALEALLSGALADPSTIEPLLANLTNLARSIRGVSAASPFR